MSNRNPMSDEELQDAAALAVLPALLARQTMGTYPDEAEAIAHDAYKIGEAMVAERKKRLAPPKGKVIAEAVGEPTVASKFRT